MVPLRELLVGEGRTEVPVMEADEFNGGCTRRFIQPPVLTGLGCITCGHFYLGETGHYYLGLTKSAFSLDRNRHKSVECASLVELMLMAARSSIPR